MAAKLRNSLARPVTTGCVSIGTSNIKQPIQFQSVHRRPQKRRIASKRIHINEIKKLSLQVTLRHDPIRIEVRHRPSSLLLQTPPNHPRQILGDDPPVLVVCVICPDEISVSSNKVPKGSDPATAQRIKNPQFTFGFLVKRSGEHAKVSTRSALLAEEGVAGLELETPFGPRLGFANVIGWWLQMAGIGESRRIRVKGNFWVELKRAN